MLEAQQNSDTEKLFQYKLSIYTDADPSDCVDGITIRSGMEFYTKYHV